MSFDQIALDNLLVFWSDQIIISVGIWLLLLVAFLYIARIPAHNAITSFTRAIRNAMRLSSTGMLRAERSLKERNKEVLIAGGREAAERYIDREFHRVEAVVSRDLANYPAMHRDLHEHITAIDEDYRQSTEVPPSPSSWVAAVEAVAKIPKNNDPVVSRILENIHTTLKKAHDAALHEYRYASRERHLILRRMMPHWRKLSYTLTSMEKKINSLGERSRIIDSQVANYNQIIAKTDQAERLLSSSSLTQFFISAIILVIAIMGGFINFQLIALPMSEMVGGNYYISGFEISDIAALVIILIEIAMGVFLMESLQITRLFPIISSMDDKMRRRMIVVSFTILLMMACVESALAYMRDLLAADKEALTQSLAGLPVATPEFRWIPSVGQMVLGFVLPFALTFVAIPFESFIHSTRTVIGVLLAAVLRFVAYILKLTGNLIFNVGHILTTFYDLLIFVPLRIEKLFTWSRKNKNVIQINQLRKFSKSNSPKDQSMISTIKSAGD